MKADAEGAFHDFVVAHAFELTRLARVLSPEPGAAQDLVQVTLLRAWRSWSRVMSAGDANAYVRRILVNAAISRSRRRWHLETPTDPLPDVTAVDEQRRVDDRDQLVRAVRSLPARQRAAVVLRYFADLDDAAVADALGCSVATVRSQISRALARLRVENTDPTRNAAAADRHEERPRT